MAIMSNLTVVNARVTYRNVPIHVLEKFAFKDVDSAYRNFLSDSSVKECLILQTCNRVEVYLAADNPIHDHLIRTWSESAGAGSDALNNYLEISTGNEMLHHLMKLASGLDSLVVGEDQILGQVKRAFDSANRNRYVGRHLSLLFDNAVKIGSKVRNSTGINKGTVSYGSMAVKLVEEHLEGLDNKKKILIIGSGEGASLVAKALKKRKIDFMVTSRTLDRAKSFSETSGGQPVAFEDALNKLSDIDAIFVATTAPYFLIPFERAEKAMQGRKSPMVIVDLSNPRTVEEKVSTLDGVKLINIDEVSALVEKNLSVRKGEIKDAEKIIQNGISTVQARMKRLEVEPIVDTLFRKVHMIRSRELEKALRMLNLDDEREKIVEQLSHAIVEGILANPMDALRRASEDGDKELMKAVLKLFKYER